MWTPLALLLHCGLLMRAAAQNSTATPQTIDPWTVVNASLADTTATATNPSTTNTTTTNTTTDTNTTTNTSNATNTTNTTTNTDTDTANATTTAAEALSPNTSMPTTAPTVLSTVASWDWRDRQVRLVSGNGSTTGSTVSGNATSCQGSLELLHDGSWGSVCSERLAALADVACLRLGCGHLGRLIDGGDAGLTGEAAAAARWNVSCGRWQPTPAHCAVTSAGAGCGAGGGNGSRVEIVQCTGAVLRLSGDPGTCSGSVQYFSNGSWHDVCASSSTPSTSSSSTSTSSSYPSSYPSTPPTTTSTTSNLTAENSTTTSTSTSLNLTAENSTTATTTSTSLNLTAENSTSTSTSTSLNLTAENSTTTSTSTSLNLTAENSTSTSSTSSPISTTSTISASLNLTADAVCRLLGCGTGAWRVDSIANFTSSSSSSSSSARPVEFSCRGNESSVFDCQLGDQDKCAGGGTLHVACAGFSTDATTPPIAATTRAVGTSATPTQAPTSYNIPFSGTSGNFCSPGFTANVTAREVIFTITTRNSFIIKLRFVSTSLDVSEQCVNTSVEVLDGATLASDSLALLCSTPLGSTGKQSITSTGSTLTLVLRAIDSLQGKGFCIDYWSVKPVTSTKACGVKGSQSPAPWAAAVVQYNATLCHATLVKPSWFLATAGCINLLVNRSDPHAPSVRLSGGVDLRVLNYSVHDRYDAALLKVATPVTGRSPACLPDYQRPSQYSGKSCLIEALDQTQVQVQMASEGSCGGPSISSQKICTQPPRSCQVPLPSNASAALMCKQEDGKWYVVGIYESGSHCGVQAEWGVFTRAWKLRKFFSDTMGDGQ